MKKTKEHLNEMTLVGITVRTSNNLEANPETAKILSTVNDYFGNGLSQKIQGRIKPDTTYCAYTEYESDENGEYTYFIGEEVDPSQKVDPIFTSLTIPASNYVKFECGPGKMPTVCIDAWKEIWQMSSDDLGGKRAYIADFELYGEKAQDCSNAALDIYIGIQQPT